jgi:hypothetical protein
VSDARNRDRSCKSFWKTAPGPLIAAAIVLAAVSVWIAVLLIWPALLGGQLPAARKTPELAELSAQWLLTLRSPSVTTIEIGRSVQDRPIHAARLGTGLRTFVIAGAIHGSEVNTMRLIESLAARLADTPDSLPRDVSLFFVPGLNPDGLATRSRDNARGVDLNRNWNTNNWRADAVQPPDGPQGTGDPSPFSEPETAAFSTWLLSLRDQSTIRVSVISYHSACPPRGLVQPGYQIVDGRQETDPNAATLGQYWATRLGYSYSPTWPEYPVTGEAIHWCAENEITCIDIELPTASDPTDAEVQLHLSTLLDMIRE